MTTHNVDFYKDSYVYDSNSFLYELYSFAGDENKYI